jgi:hypothetical protein
VITRYLTFDQKTLAMPYNTRLSRVVLNHSTHIDGLIAVLKRIEHSSVNTIVPGRLSRVVGGPEKRLTFRVSSSVVGGWRVIAQRGSQLQEVFCSGTALSQEELLRVLEAARGELK